MKIGKYTIDISNRDKVFFPKKGYTKGDLIDYYEDISGIFIRHCKNNPISMKRYPDGIEKDGFFQKNASDYFPEWIETVHFPKRGKGSFDAPVIDMKATLVYLANQAMITPHLYLAAKDSLEYADRMIFDIDPPEGTSDYSLAREAAFDINGLLEDTDIKCFAQTTGSNGYHLIVPLDSSQKFDYVRNFARDIAEVLIDRYPNKYTLEQYKKNRGEKIYMDIGRNSYGSTSVAPYSVRPLPNAPVATPIELEELKNGVDPQKWTMKDIHKRLGKMSDPMKNFRRSQIDLSKHREKLDDIMKRQNEKD